MFTPDLFHHVSKKPAHMEQRHLKDTEEAVKLTHPPAAQQHPSSRGITASWAAAARRTARGTSPVSPSEMLTSPSRRVKCHLPAAKRWFLTEKEQGSRERLDVRAPSLLSTGGAEVKRGCSDRTLPLCGAQTQSV